MENMTVLVADDAELMRRRLITSLTELGIKDVLEAEDGKQAVVHFSSASIDLAFLDINMPKLDGLEVLKRVVANKPNAYIVIVSGDSTAKNVKEAITSGAKGFIVKPLSEEKISEAINNYQQDRLALSVK